MIVYIHYRGTVYTRQMVVYAHYNGTVCTEHMIVNYEQQMLQYHLVLQDPKKIRQLEDLVGRLHGEVSACNEKKEEVNSLVDNLVKLFDDEIQKNKIMDGLIENCREDKVNLSHVF